MISEMKDTLGGHGVMLVGYVLVSVIVHMNTPTAGVTLDV